MSPSPTTASPRLLLLSVALLAGAALAYQVLLIRLLAIVHWHPFAALIVSLALLGHGVSGSVLAVWGARWRSDDLRPYWLGAVAFALVAPLGFALAQRLPFNGLSLVWDGWQWLWLGTLYAVLGLPFFCAAGAIGWLLLRPGGRIPSLYAADLFGAGLGSGLVIVAVDRCSLSAVLVGIDLMALAAALALVAALPQPRRGLAAVVLAGAALLALPVEWLAPQPNPYKALPRAMLVPQTQLLATHSNAYGLLQVVQSRQIPVRDTPGLTLGYAAESPEQLAVFTDGDALAAISAGAPPESLNYLRHSVQAVAFVVSPAQRVLILGAGAGNDLRQALLFDVPFVHAVERNPAWMDVMVGRFAEFSGRLYNDPRLKLRIDDARSVLRQSGDEFDVILWPLGDSAAVGSAGLQAAGDNFLYTVQALRDAYARLTPNGVLALSRWEHVPARDALKLVAMAVAALREQGITEAGDHLVLIRGWDSHTLLIGRSAFTADQLQRVQRFCRDHQFDQIWPQGLAALYHDDRGALGDGVRALLGSDADVFIEDYPFDLRPPSDDRPFFHHGFRWRSLPQLWRQQARGGLVLLDAGYVLLVAALLQAGLLSLLLLLVPLRLLPAVDRPASARNVPRTRTALYFFCLGVGFLAVEIIALSRWTLLIGHPLLATASVLGGLLVFAGMGSAWAQGRAHGSAHRAAAIVAVLLLLNEWLFPRLLPISADWHMGAKLLLCLASLAPLGWAMGQPFPLALARLSATAPTQLPWAWGINGCASVVGALLTVLGAIEFGYAAVSLAAALLYGAAALLARRW